MKRVQTEIEIHKDIKPHPHVSSVLSENKHPFEGLALWAYELPC